VRSEDTVRPKDKKNRRASSEAVSAAGDGTRAASSETSRFELARAGAANAGHNRPRVSRGGVARPGTAAAAAGEVTPEANGSVFADSAPSRAAADGAEGDGPPTEPRITGAHAHERSSGKKPPAKDGRSNLRSLKNWRVRSRLLLLVAIPTVTALAFGGFRIASSVQSASAYQRVLQLSTLGRDVTHLAQALEDERDQTVYFIALGSDNGGRADSMSSNPSLRANAAPEVATLHQLYSQTDAEAATVSKLARQIGTSYPTQTQQAAGTLLDALSGLPSLRTASTQTQLPLLDVIQKYSNTITAVLGINNDIAAGVGDPILDQTVNVLGLVSLLKDDASVQRAVLSAALIQGAFTPSELSELQDSELAEQTTLQAFDTGATPSQLALWNSSVALYGGQASADELQAQSLAGNSSSESLAADPTTPGDWYSSMTSTIHGQMGGVEQSLVSSVTARAASLRRGAITFGAIIGAVVLLVLALALMFTVVVGRSMVRPLRTLRSDALRIAGVRLPDMVKRLSESEADEHELEIEPIAVDSTDEIGEVARAFDQVHSEAVRLASNEARLRGNVNAMFVNLSRRSQSLVERQIQLIDDLEQGEQDSDRLGSLFRLDHLATRMRRNSENLLVLAGHEGARHWTQPVPLVDVLRAAVSEIEHYERVKLNVQPGISVRGQVVNDVVHLLAELVENATAFSSSQTEVRVSGHLLNSGGVLLDITDQGVGMAPDEMAHANWRLDNPPVVDVAVSRRMGLFVVARLASRHGIRVRLRPAPSGGLTALIWLPDETVTHEVSGVPAGLRRFEADKPTGVLPDTGLGDRPDLGGASPLSAAQAAVAAARAPRFVATGKSGDEDTTIGPLRGLGQRHGDNGHAGVADDAPAMDGELPDNVGEGPPAGTRDGQPEAVFGAPITGLADSLGISATTRSSSILDDADLGSGSSGSALAEPDHWAGWRPAEESEERFGLATHRDADVGGLAGVGAGLGGLGGGAGGTADSPGSVAGEVIVPPVAPSVAEESRLPIFESVESDWFRRGRLHVGITTAEQEVDQTTGGWNSPADAGWRAAEAVESPSSGGITATGLPKRVPQANLVPGGVAEQSRAATGSGYVRSAATTRDRMASFQRGAREGRAALRSDEASGEEDQDA
jgi:signal transduction histidine kinase